MLDCFESVIRHVNDAFHKTNERLVLQAILEMGLERNRKFLLVQIHTCWELLE